MKLTFCRVVLMLSACLAVTRSVHAQRIPMAPSRNSSAMRHARSNADAKASAPMPDLSNDFTFVPFGNPAGALEGLPLGINDRGDVAGFFVDANFLTHAYIWRKGKFTVFDEPNTPLTPAGGTDAGGINDRGDVTGIYYDSNGFQHGYIRRVPDGCAEENESNCKPVYTTTDVPGASLTTIPYFEFGPGLGTAPIGINDFGATVGMYAHDVYSNGFIREPSGEYKHVDAPGAAHTLGMGTKLFGINDWGAVVGDYQTPGATPFSQLTHAFILQDGRYTQVDVPGSTDGGFGTQLNGINSLGVAVGVYTDSSGILHGLMWWGGTTFKVDYPGAPFSEIHAINNLGVFTGAYTNDPEGEILYGYIAYPKKH